MTKKIIVIQLLLVKLCFSQFSPEWVKFYNAEGNSQDFGYSLVIDNENNVIVSGTSQTLLSSEDFVTVKYSPGGAQLWANRYTGTGLTQETCFINAIDDKNNIYTGGISTVFNGWNYVMIKYDKLGSIKWVNKIHNNTNQVGYFHSISLDDAFNVYYVVSAPGLVSELVKLDSNGITQWRRSLTGNVYGSAFCVIDNPTNSVIVCSTVPDTVSGLLITKFSESGNTLWTNYIKRYGTYEGITPKDICIINSNIYITSNISSAILILKYSPSGSFLWGKIYDSYILNSSRSVIPAGEEQIYIGGIASGTNDDFLIMKYSPDGNLLWDRVFDSGSNDNLYDICSDENNNIYASGISDHGCSTAKFDKDGNYITSDIYKIQPDETSWGFSNGYANNSLYVTGYGIGNGTGCDIITLKYGTLIGLNPVSQEIPVNFSLSQNYPNPFNPTTNFEFRIPDFGLVNLTIYDAMGRVVETLQNGEMKPGVYKAEWNASGYPSGVYFYKLSAGKFTETKKMILTK